VNNKPYTLIYNFQQIIAFSLDTVPIIIGKATPERGRGDPYSCETSRLPRFLNKWLTDGGEVSIITIYNILVKNIST
jgi:hypothetical protein